MTIVKSTYALVFTATVFAAACGDSKSSMLPTAPSALGAPSQSDEAGFEGVSGPTAKGGVPGPPESRGGNGNGNGNGKQPNGNPGERAPSNTSPGAPSLKKVELEGLITAKSGDSITVSGQQVVVPPTCPIRHGQTPFTFADLEVGDRVHVRASRLTTESSVVMAVTTLEATEVILQNPDERGTGSDTPSDLVSVAATDAFASESPVDKATFTVTRSGSDTLLAAPLTLSYTVGGTATSGDDYTALSGSVTFAAGVATATIDVTPIADSTSEGAETVAIVLTTVAPYDLGAPAEATVTITDTNVPVVTVAAFDSTASETPSNQGRFRFSRTGPTTSALTVAFTVDGSATAGTDYTALPASVVIPAGASFADVYVTPLRDSDAGEAAETVVVTVTDGASYDLGATTTSTVTISN